MHNAKTISVSFDPHIDLRDVEGELSLDNVPYKEAIGSLMFLMVVLRPDLAHAVNAVNRYLNKHNNSHWQAVKRIIRYLIGTSNLGYRVYRRQKRKRINRIFRWEFG